MLVNRSIAIGQSKLSPLHWTAVSWLAGIIIAAPILPALSRLLNHSHQQPLILGAGTAIGSFICLLTGFFKTIWPFPFYIAVITVCITAASSIHTHHLSLIVAGNTRQRMSLSATAVGSLATAVLALFTYHMLRRADHLTSLWVVSIFCGLKWFLGLAEAFIARRPGSPSTSTLRLASNSWPQLGSCLVGVFISSFSSICIFASATLYVVGGLCMKPVLVLVLWMVYFSFAAVSLPLLHPLRLLIRGNPVKMNLLGLLMSAVASGSGFYFKNHNWDWVVILAMGLVQATGAGILHAYGRVMILDRAPAGKEGAISSWYEWVKVTGACAGFALAAACPDDVGKTFGVSFLAVVIGFVVLIFGSDFGDSGGGSGRGDESREYIESGSELDGEMKDKVEEVSVQVV